MMYIIKNMLLIIGLLYCMIASSMASTISDQLIELNNIKHEMYIGNNNMQYNITELEDLIRILSNVQEQGKYIIVNIPSYTLYAYENGNLVFTSKIIVGKTTSKTPIMKNNLTAVKLNPDWTVPASLVKHDILSGIKKQNFSWIDKHNITAIDQYGIKHNPKSLNLDDLKNSKFIWRQPPGINNALGIIKFELDNNKNIYIHDTNRRDLFTSENRRYSSGCVRLEKYLDLAAWLLNKSPDDIEQMLQNKVTRYLRIEPVPVDIVYSTIYMTNNSIIKYNDVYHMMK